MRRVFAGHEEPAESLEPIRVYTAETVFDGWVAPDDERMTDLLARGAELSVLPHGANQDDPGSWLAVRSEELLMVVPPPHVSPPDRRAERDKREVRLRVGEYVAAGVAHLRPGLEHDPYTRVTRPFLPLTAATVMRADGAEWITVDVVIVNLRWAEFLEV